MSTLKWLAGGMIGGLIGAAIWAAVGYFSGYEVGWIAWGIGFLAGFGVRLAAGESYGAAPGLSAVAAAIGCVALAKYAVVWLALGDVPFTPPDVNNPEVMIGFVAGAIAEEHEAAGRVVNWPDIDENAEVKSNREYFPPEIWNEASKRWNDMPAENRQALRDKLSANARDVDMGAVRQFFFQRSFTAMDLLWFGLAAYTAFRLGSGTHKEE